METKISKCKIGKVKGKPNPVVVVKFEDGTTELLFSYNPQEITLREVNFIGLTKLEAYLLRSQKENIFLTK